MGYRSFAAPRLSLGLTCGVVDSPGFPGLFLVLIRPLGHLSPSSRDLSLSSRRLVLNIWHLSPSTRRLSCSTWSLALKIWQLSPSTRRLSRSIWRLVLNIWRLSRSLRHLSRSPGKPGYQHTALYELLFDCGARLVEHLRSLGTSPFPVAASAGRLAASFAVERRSPLHLDYHLNSLLFSSAPRC